MSQRYAANAARRAARPRALGSASAAGVARACALWLSSALCAFAQAPEASGIERLVAADAARALWSDDPECRGEAALIVAAEGGRRYERRLLELALDKEDSARRRALVALGLLATPPAIEQLARALATVDARGSDDGVCAAFALGIVPSDRAETTVARTLARFREGSWKRQHAVLVTLLGAMARDPGRTELEALRQLLREGSNRDADVRGLLWSLLLPIDDSIRANELKRVLRRGDAAERRAVVKWLADRDPERNAAWIEDLSRLADRDRDPDLRALALRALARCEVRSSLETAANALRSSHGVERRSAVETMLAIGGASVRGELEQHLIKERDLRRATELFEGFRAPPSAALREHLVAVAAAADAPARARVAAAELLARSAAGRPAPILRGLFVELDDPALLARIARALSLVAEAPTPAAKLLGATVAWTHHPARWRALLAAGHPEAQRQVLTILKDDDASTSDRRCALKAWRAAVVLGPTDSAPKALRDALR